MDTRYQIFVSSTYTDLIEERKEITQAILECDCFPAGMELFPAANKKQWDIIKKVIDDSDFYIIISAGRYGSLGTDDDGNTVSYTEMEFDYALKTGKPILAFVYQDIESLPSKDCENTDDGRARLKAFRNKILDGRLAKFWSNKDQLKSAAISAINNTKKDTDASGWIKANIKIDKSAYRVMEEQRKDYESKIAELNNKIGIIERDSSQKDAQIVNLSYKLSDFEEYNKSISEDNRYLKNQIRLNNSFWDMFALINARCEYFKHDHNHLLEALKTEYYQALTSEQLFFINHCSGLYNWETVTQKAFALQNDFFQKNDFKKHIFLTSIKLSLEDYIVDRDCYACTDEDFESLFSTCFCIIFLSSSFRSNYLNELIQEIKDSLLKVCDDFVETLYDIEQTLCENDY